jgi:hypothetical protein
VEGWIEFARGIRDEQDIRTAVLEEHGLDGDKTRWVEHEFPAEPLGELLALR